MPPGESSQSGFCRWRGLAATAGPGQMERVEQAAEKVDSSFKKPGGAREGRESGSEEGTRHVKDELAFRLLAFGGKRFSVYCL